MDWINDRIAIGNHLEATDAEVISSGGFQAILCLDGKLRGRSPADLAVEQIAVFDLIDGSGNDPSLFQEAVAALQQLVAEHSPALVHCHAGRSRSPIVVAGYLVAEENLFPEDALAQVMQKRETKISSGLEELLYWL